MAVEISSERPERFQARVMSSRKHDRADERLNGMIKVIAVNQFRF